MYYKHKAKLKLCLEIKCLLSFLFNLLATLKENKRDESK